jgi:hypothetical protein
MELTERQRAEAELSIILNEVQAGNLSVSLCLDFIMDNLSEKGIRTLSDDNADRKVGPFIS